ncbi:MAG: hypothetical protein IJC71_01310 [Clostridia bacterium]|nr:hypothetical protein [Clostridia bacterium]
MAELITYKCPCCGGAIEFDSTAQKMKCPYCDTEYEMETLQSFDAVLQDEKEDEMQWEQPEEDEWSEEEKEGLRSYVCHSCGGEVITDETTGASACPYCGNPIVMTEQFAGNLRPDFIIPFKLDKKAAKEGLARHLSNKRFLPKVFKDENHLDEVRGIYVPFWLFDSEADAQLRFKGSKIRTWHDARYNYTETSYYSVVRGGEIAFENVPVDGSTKMPDDLMESVEPFDLSEAVDFQTAYMSGYLADKYDVTAEESVTRANERIKQSVEQAFTRAAQPGYASLIPEQNHVQLKKNRVRYGLYPVWVLNTTWNGEKYIFAMNGQTGKFVGNLPVDKGIYWKYVGIGTAIASVLVYGLVWLMNVM